MEIEQALRTYLLTKTGLTSLVGTRILHNSLSDGAALPVVIYFKVSDVKDHTLAGQSTLERPVFQFSAYAASQDSARAITNQLKAALVDYSGTLSGVEIQHITLISEYSTVQNDGAARYYIEDLEFEISFIKE